MRCTRSVRSSPPTTVPGAAHTPLVSTAAMPCSPPRRSRSPSSASSACSRRTRRVRRTSPPASWPLRRSPPRPATRGRPCGPRRHRRPSSSSRRAAWVRCPARRAKGGGQALLVGLMVLAFLVLVIARTQSPAASGGATPDPVAGGGVAGASASPASHGDRAARAPTASPSPSPSPTPSPSPSATPAPTAKATPRPTAAATRRYRVKAGDTLSSIAARYGTTVRVLARLNDISDPRIIRIGQVLQIP